MRKPWVEYRLDKVLGALVEATTGQSDQEIMIAAEICVAAGLASRDFSQERGRVVLSIRASDTLRERVSAIVERNQRNSAESTSTSL